MKDLFQTVFKPLIDLIGFPGALFNAKSDVSSMRFMSVFTVFAATALSFYGLHKGLSPEGMSILAGVFLTTAFGGKAVQKHLENKNVTTTEAKSETTEQGQWQEVNKEVKPA